MYIIVVLLLVSPTMVKDALLLASSSIPFSQLNMKLSLLHKLLAPSMSFHDASDAAGALWVWFLHMASCCSHLQVPSNAVMLQTQFVLQTKVLDHKIAAMWQLQCDTDPTPLLLRATCTTCAQAQQFNHDNEHSQQQHTHSCSFHISNPSTLRTYIPSLSSTYISAILLACLHVCLLVGMHVGLPTYPT